MFCSKSFLGRVACVALLTFAAVSSAQTIWYVDDSATGANDGTSWADAFTSVQAGLNAATDGQQVWVAAGTYDENITLKLGVALYGGFAGNEDRATFDLADRDFAANETILDGNQAGSVVTVPENATADTLVDGFTIEYGTFGIYCLYGSPTIANNVIKDNGGSTGGGVYCLSSSPTITNNTIIRNHASFRGGGIYCSSPTSSSAVIVNNKIIGNTTTRSGGGIYCSGGSPIIAKNILMGNVAIGTSGGEGGGLCCSGSSSSFQIVNNVIIGNRADYGGGLYCHNIHSFSKIANNKMMENDAFFGGGLYVNSSPTITNNTITANRASVGGGIIFYSGSPVIANNIVAFNLSGIYSGSSATPVLRCNCVYNNTAYNYDGITDPTGSGGNISADPMLADLSYGNVHIQSNSPCVDAGNNTYAFGDYDLGGRPRILPANGTVDIGAYEFDGTIWSEGPYIIVRVAPDGNDTNDGSSWLQAKRTVQAAIDAASILGGEVWVSKGTYYERIILHPYVYLYGGFSKTENARSERDWKTNATVLDGQAGGSVVTIPSGFQVSTIDGFTIRNGTGTLDYNISSRFGGGIYAEDSPIIANNTITANSADSGGGVVAASATITNNTITGNSASSSGGGIYCVGSATIINNTITGNVANGSQDIDGGGGGIYCDFSSPTMTNNTITGNIAPEGGGIRIFGNSSSPMIGNTITAFNSSGISKSGTGLLTLRNNCVFGNNDYDYQGTIDPTGSDGNISADPKLIDLTYQNVHIQPDSPCVDAGQGNRI